MQFFLDANILFSDCISPAGRSAALIDLANRGFCEALTSAHAVDAFVTGARTHFGRLFGRTCDGVRILSLREALKKAME
jgi:predicted nucleic acid-binding protein